MQIYISFLLVMLLLTNEALAQKKGKLTITTETIGEAPIENYQCVETNRCTLEERINLYPFNEANEIVIVSIDNTTKQEIIKVGMYINSDTTNPIDSVKIFNEIKLLNKKDLELLTHIFYNYNFKGKTYDEVSFCYNPRNAIAFLNKEKKVFEFIEICLECFNYRHSSDKVVSWDLCHYKGRMLRDFFISKGINIGTNR